MHFTRKPVYKARTPEETIRLVRDIMYEGNIFLCEDNIYHKTSRTAASTVRFGDEAFDGSRYATNGKGMNPRYSLASAYGEMMERFESGIFFRNERKQAFDEGRVKYACAPDEKRVPFGKLCPEAEQSLKLLLRLTDEEYGAVFADARNEDVVCVPYLDALTGCELFLPVDLYMFLFTSNGLCAGNTRNEALAQGISELFERAALTEIFYRNPPLPQLRDDCFEGSEVLNKLRFLQEQGYGHKILDASMSLGYPVLGLILEKDGGIMFDLGADPNPVVALERCLTELFQCIQEGKHELRLCKESCGLYADWKFAVVKKWYHSQFLRAKTAASGLKPDNLFKIPEEYSESYLWNEAGTDDFEYLLELIKELGYHLYIRDFSYLGFPAYQAVIPELSLADFDLEERLKIIPYYMQGKVLTAKYTKEQYEGLLPVFDFVEKKQEAYYGRRADC